MKWSQLSHRSWHGDEISLSELDLCSYICVCLFCDHSFCCRDWESLFKMDFWTWDRFPTASVNPLNLRDLPQVPVQRKRKKDFLDEIRSETWREASVAPNLDTFMFYLIVVNLDETDFNGPYQLFRQAFAVEYLHSLEGQSSRSHLFLLLWELSRVEYIPHQSCTSIYMNNSFYQKSLKCMKRWDKGAKCFFVLLLSQVWTRDAFTVSRSLMVFS